MEAGIHVPSSGVSGYLILFVICLYEPNSNIGYCHHMSLASFSEIAFLPVAG